MKKLFLLSGIVLLVLSNNIYAQVEYFNQYITNSLRLSQTNAGATARSSGMAGAWGALGGDFYSATQNPAGLGFYTRSEMTFSPDIMFDNSKSTYYGNEVESREVNPNFSSLGYVYSFLDKNNNSGYLGGSFAVGFNKIGNFHSDKIIKGINNTNSFSEAAVDIANANGLTPDNINANGNGYFPGLFWEGYIMDYNENGFYIDDANYPLPVIQDIVINSRGKANEWTFALGFNYSHVFYFGASLAFVSTEYYETFYVEERGNNDLRLDYTFTEEIKTTGIGTTGKLGFIYKPLKILTVGFTYHLPTFYNLDQFYDTRLRSDSVNGTLAPMDEFGSGLDAARYNYKNTTPGKMVFSAALFPTEFLLVSTDVEYINYKQMKLENGSDGYNFSLENQDMEYTLNAAINAKVGAEARFGPLRLRGGFAFLGNPYEKIDMNNLQDIFKSESDLITENAHTVIYTLGAGIRFENFFIDVAQQYRTTEQPLKVYSVGNAHNFANIENNRWQTTATIGFRF